MLTSNCAMYGRNVWVVGGSVGGGRDVWVVGGSVGGGSGRKHQ